MPPSHAHVGSQRPRASLTATIRAETDCMAGSILHCPQGSGGETMTSLCFQSALRIAAQLRNREIGAVECLEYFRARVDRLNTDLNAIVVLDWDRASERARHADDALARGCRAVRCTACR